MTTRKNRLSEPRPINHLNSIWLEGTLVAEPEPDALGWAFKIRGGPSEFDVLLAGANVPRERMEAGRRVRVIGRLFQRRPNVGDEDRVAIWGELVEPLAGVPHL